MTKSDIWQELLSQPLWIAYQIQGGRFDMVKFCPTHGIFWEFADSYTEQKHWPDGSRADMCGDASWEACFGVSGTDAPLLRKTMDYDKDTLKQLLEATRKRHWEELEVSHE